MKVDGVSFQGYNSPLKSNWRKGRLPSVKRGFYGDILTQNNLSLEHLKPHSKGGKTVLSNLVLASQDKNSLRGDKNIKQFADKQTVLDYLIQFIGVKTKDFNGDKYIASIIQTLESLGLDITR